MINNSKIRLVLFDIGGVVIEWQDSWLYHQVAQKYGIDENKLSKECETEIPRLHSGEIQESEFWKTIGKKINSEEIMSINRSFFYEIFKKEIKLNHEVLSLVKKIKKKGFKVGVLSNLEKSTNLVLNELGMFEDFEFQFLSHRIGFAKPNKRIFEYVLKKIPFKKNEIIFIDDKPQNVKAAITLGINAIQYSNVKQLHHDLCQIDVL